MSVTFGASTPLRIVPVELFVARRPHRMVERSLLVLRRSPMIFVSGFFEPLFYLLSIRVGLAELIGDVEYNGQLVAYDAFVAPALMAASAMNGAIFDSTMNVFHKIKHSKLYDAVLTTPLSTADVAVGEISWAMLRGAAYSVAFLVTMWLLGLTSSPWVILSVPICVLIGFAFAALGMAATSYARSWSDFEYLPAIQIPLFLFSATFYPLSTYGSWGWVVQLSPLYHGVALVRMSSFGEWEWAALVHVAVLLGLAAFGIVASSRRLHRLLLT
ncbi:MAG TPA: ABC transporter permease [Ilumatobacteraceae bacterium]